MISTESGYEDWLEQRRVAFEGEKKLTQKNQQNQEQKKNIVFFVAQRKTGNMFMKY